MKKTKIELKINEYFLNTIGYLNNNILSFFDKDQNKTEMILDLNTNRFIRNNNECKIEIDFNQEEIKYYLKKEDLKFTQNIKTIMLKKNNNEYIINYQIEENPFVLNIKYEEEK